MKPPESCINSTVAFKAPFIAVFPDLRGLAEEDDRMPGREVAEFIAHGLKERGFDPSAVTNDEPFFTTRCKPGPHEYSIIAYIGDPDQKKLYWGVECLV